MVQSCYNNRRTQTNYDLHKAYKKNKTVVKADKASGEFTQVSYRILHNKNLTSDARILLISILSDSDTFNISRIGLINRLGISEYRLDEAFKNLIEFGFLRKTKVHAQYFHYTISEYGNLNQNEEELKKNPQTSPNDKESEQSQSKESSNIYGQEQRISDYNNLQNFLVSTSNYFNETLILNGFDNIETRDDFFKFKKEAEKDINKSKVKHYKDLEQYVLNCGASKERKPQILKELRRLITDEHKRPSMAQVDKIRNTISQNAYKNKVKKNGFDNETQLVDDYENPQD